VTAFLDPAPARVVLLGLMGSGKSTVARALSRRLGWPRLDNDEQVAARAGASAREVARRDGLDRLHEVEAGALREALAQPPPFVVTAAASVVDDDEHDALLATRAFTVWLRARPTTLAERVRRGPDRPILDDDRVDVRATLAAQEERRGPRLLALADLVVDVDDHSPGEITDRIVAALVTRQAAGPGPAAPPPG
jgi:shikimate kinase